MKKYEVVITRFDSEKREQVKEVAGTFDKWLNANIFAKAYADFYSASVEIREIESTVRTYEVTRF